MESFGVYIIRRGGLRCSFYDMGKFEGLDSGTATIRFHVFYIDD